MSEAFLRTNGSQIFEYCGNSDEIPLTELVKIAEKLKHQLRNLPRVVLYKCSEPQSNENNETSRSKNSNSTRNNPGSADDSLDAEDAGQNFSSLFYETQVSYDDDSAFKEMVDNVWKENENEDTNYKRVSSPETTRATNALEQLLSKENMQSSSSRSEIYGNENASQKDKRKSKSKSRFSIDECFNNWMAGEESRSPKRKKQKSNTPHTSAETNNDEQEEVNVPNITIAPDNASATIVNVDVTPNGCKKGVIEVDIPQSLANSINKGSYKIKIDLSKITILKNFTKPAASSGPKSKAVVKKATTPKPKARAPRKRGPKPRKAVTNSSSSSAEKSEVAKYVELFSSDCNEYMADTNMSTNVSSNVVSTTTGQPNGNNWEIIRPAILNGHPPTTDTVSSTQVSSSQIARLSTANGIRNSWSDELYILPLEGLGEMPLVKYINDSADVQTIDQLQRNGVTNNVIENTLVPYRPNYLGQQAERKSLPLPVQLNPPIINVTSSSMIPVAAPGIKMDTISENDSDSYVLDLTKQKLTSDADLLQRFENSIANSNQSLPEQFGPSPSMPSLDDVADVVNEMMENESNSIPNSKTDVENSDGVESPEKNAEISTETKVNFNGHNIPGDPEEIDVLKLLEHPHCDDDDEDAISLCASNYGTPFRDNLDGFDIPGDASFKHVYSSTPLQTTESDGASSMNSLKQCLKSSTATGQNFTTATMTSKDSVQPNNQPKQIQLQNDNKQTPFQISKVSQEQKIVKSFRRPSLTPLTYPKFEDKISRLV